MEVLEFNFKKWEQTTNNFTGNITDGEVQSFLLYPHHPTFKSLLLVTPNIYLTDNDTDFILDVDIDSLVQFDIKGSIPTIEEIYEAYVFVRKTWNVEIWKRLKEDSNINLFREAPPPPLEELRPYLQAALDQTYPLN